MPLLKGADRSKGVAIDLASQKFIQIKNLQITAYEIGVMISSADQGGYNSIENVISVDLGNINDNYSGVAFKAYKGGNNVLKYCTAINAAAEGISIENSNNNLVENCRVLCNDTTNINSGTDYYIYIGGSNNTIRNCYIERIGDLQHGGHGIGVKGDGQNNLFEDCEAKNIAGGGFYVRHRGAKYNTFKNCRSIKGAGLMIRDGASYNKFYNCNADSCYESVVFLDTDEDGGAQFAGRYNDFYNCLFEHSHFSINFCQYNLNSDASNNRFINCLFYEGDYLFRSLRTNYDNVMTNCIVMDMNAYKSGESGEYPLDFNFTNTDFYNNGFLAPTGINLLEVDPLFIDAPDGDYHLLPGSPCIDAGTADTSGLDLPPFDAGGSTRIADGNDDGLSIIDLGIYEYGAPSAIVNYALAFNLDGDVNNQFITAKDFSSLGSSFTMEAWIKLSEIPTGSDEAHIMEFWSPDAAIQTQLYINSSGNLSSNGSSGAAGITGRTVLETNRWYHIAYVRTISSVKIYLDGELEAEKTDGTDGGAFSYLVLGRFRGDESQYGFSAFRGVMDEVRIWSYARTESEIIEEKDKELTGAEYGLEAYYNFNVGKGTILPDFTDNEHDGILHNMNDDNWVSGVFAPVGMEDDRQGILLPKRYTLEQNYPNPFNPTTTIRFNLPVASLVNLSVYNILGEEVAVLVNHQLSSGIHSVIFDASNLSSGIYFYRITAKNFISVKKMMLLR